MGERQGVSGDFWTNKAVKLLADCGWQQRGADKVDFPCTVCRPKTTTHHGIDVVESYYNPFNGQDVGVLVETKNYAWDNMNRATIQEWVADLVKKMECIPQAGEFVQLFNPDGIMFETGFLLVWCNTPEQYDWDKFVQRVRGVEIPRRNSNLRVFIASNREIEQWRSVVALRDALKKDYEDLAVFYPSVERSVLQRRDCFTLELMYSKYIFAKGTGKDRARDVQTSFVFVFEPATLDALNFAYIAAKEFQLEDSEELRFFLYEEDPHVRRAEVETFLRETNAELTKAKARCRIRVDFIPQVRGLS